MTNYLETVKDLIEGCGKTNGTCERCQDGTRTDTELDAAGIICHSPKVDYQKLHAVAIKWLKELQFRESYQGHTHTESGHALNDHALIHSIDWIKHFFNISEEELK